MADKAAIQKRAQRIRRQIKKVANGRPRLSVHRTSLHIYAQVIDDVKGHTLAAASSLEKGSKGKSGANVEAAAAVGKRIAEKALAAGIQSVAFDRAGYRYHGRVKALAEAAREGGLSF